MNIQDNWITFVFHTNWDNASFTIWNNITGTPVEVGYAKDEGWYQITKPTSTGAHVYYILINGTHDGADSTSQVCNPALTNDAWKWRTFTLTINPVTFSITDVTIWQNNDTIILSGQFFVPNVTITYTVDEGGSNIASGTLVLSASGEWNSITWTKVNMTTLQTLNLTMTSDSSSISVHFYSLVLTGQVVYNAAVLYEGDTFIDGNVEDELSLMIVGLIITSVAIPVAIGFGFALRALQKRKKEKRIASNDIYR